jgi:acetyl-CoA carboxylase biotin carboxyl carrier protein
MGDHKDTDVEFIQALAAVLRENDLTELEVSRQTGEDQELNIRIARTVQAAPIAVSVPVAAPTPAAAAAPAAAAEAPEPTAPAFVKVGDQVSEGQTIIIVEAMKTMNQIPAPRAGTVKRILVEDKQAVEFGAPLVIVE